MKKISFKVEERFCEECSFALRRFIGSMNGVESIDPENGQITIQFDPSKITEEDVSKITRDSLEKLGHKIAA